MLLSPGPGLLLGSYVVNRVLAIRFLSLFLFSRSPSFSLTHSLSLFPSLFSSVSLLVSSLHTHKDTYNPFLNWWKGRGTERAQDFTKCGMQIS